MRSRECTCAVGSVHAQAGVYMRSQVSPGGPINSCLQLDKPIKDCCELDRAVGQETMPAISGDGTMVVRLIVNMAA